MLSRDQARDVYGHLRVIELVATTRTFSYDAKLYDRVRKIQGELDAIKNILSEPEPDRCVDFHKMFASQTFEVPPEEVTPQQRDTVMLAVFRTLYGGVK